jgi:hypothetical protein
MPAPRKKWLCVSYERNNGIFKAHFQREGIKQPEDLYSNEEIDSGKPDPYVQGLYYWWSSEGAFPQR